MNERKNLGANIRGLRMAFGETQEELGAAINVEKNTVSNYERSKREPGKDTLAAIANHYMVSVDELLYEDFSSLKMISVDAYAFWRNIDAVLPIVSSEQSMQNESFKKAYITHSTCYKQVKSFNFEVLLDLIECLESYGDAEEDESIELEVVMNYVAGWFLIMMLFAILPVFNKMPAPVWQVTRKDEVAKKAIEEAIPMVAASMTDLTDLRKQLVDAEILVDTDMIPKLLAVIKQSTEWSDLAEYYLALQYIWNIVDNELDHGLNLRIGKEMLNAFSSIGNRYCRQYLRIARNASHGASSQSVDDINK